MVWAFGAVRFCESSLLKAETIVVLLFSRIMYSVSAFCLCSLLVVAKVWLKKIAVVDKIRIARKNTATLFWFKSFWRPPAYVTVLLSGLLFEETREKMWKSQLLVVLARFRTPWQSHAVPTAKL